MHVANTSLYKTHEIWNFLETDKSLALSVGVIMITMCPMIVLGNTMILLRHWSMSLRSHVRYARETRAVTCKRTFEVVAR